MCIHCERIPKLINISIISHTFLHVGVSAHVSSSLANFNYTILSTVATMLYIVTMLYVTSSDLIYHVTEVILLLPFPYCLYPSAPSNHHSTLFCEFNFFFQRFPHISDTMQYLSLFGLF